MKDGKLQRFARFGTKALVVLTVLSAGTTVLLNAQSIRLGSAAYEVACWVGLGGAVLVALAALVGFVLILVKREEILASVRFSRPFVYTASVAVCLLALLAAAALVLQYGLLSLLEAEL